MAALSIKDEKNVVALLNPEKSYGFIDLHALHPQLTTTVPVILYRESKTAALNKVSAVRIWRPAAEDGTAAAAAAQDIGEAASEDGLLRELFGEDTVRFVGGWANKVPPGGYDATHILSPLQTESSFHDFKIKGGGRRRGLLNKVRAKVVKDGAHEFPAYLCLDPECDPHALVPGARVLVTRFLFVEVQDAEELAKRGFVRKEQYFQDRSSGHVPFHRYVFEAEEMKKDSASGGESRKVHVSGAAMEKKKKKKAPQGREEEREAHGNASANDLVNEYIEFKAPEANEERARRAAAKRDKEHTDAERISRLVAAKGNGLTAEKAKAQGFSAADAKAAGYSAAELAPLCARYPEWPGNDVQVIFNNRFGETCYCGPGNKGLKFDGAQGGHCPAGMGSGGRSVGLWIALKFDGEGEQPDGAELIAAVRNDDLEEVNRLLTGGADPDATLFGREKDPRDGATFTALVVACNPTNVVGPPIWGPGGRTLKNADRIVEALLTAGASTFCVDACLCSPLMICCGPDYEGHFFNLNVVRMLLASGANVNHVTTYDKRTAIIVAVEHALRNFLPDEGGDLAMGCRVDAYPPHVHQLYSGKVSRVRGDGTYDIAFDDGDHAQGLARDRITSRETAPPSEEALDCIRMLLAAGADPTIASGRVCDTPMSAIQKAQEAGDPAVLQCFIDAGHL
jgi:hypothetical protein